MAATVYPAWSGGADQKYPEANYAYVQNGHLYVLTGDPNRGPAEQVAIYAPGSWHAYEIQASE